MTTPSVATPTLLRGYLLDDEPLALRRLTRLLQASGRVEIVGSSTDPETALSELSAASTNQTGLTALQIDVLFLDIEMPRMNGFEFLSALSIQPRVIFTTAYDRYALRAFEVNSIDYLLKPIDAPQLERALSKIEAPRLNAIAPSSDFALQPQFEAVVRRLTHEFYSTSARFPSRIASKLGDKVRFIPLTQVTHFLARNKLTYAVTSQHEYSVDYSITELESKLDPVKFVRVHRSVLLNLDYIHEIHSLLGGRALIYLDDAKRTTITAARDRVAALREHLDF
ncbi:MAG TPA: LytTR family DNA-binding domain-containing protein [Abditibacteriaceae bacterium]